MNVGRHTSNSRGWTKGYPLCSLALAVVVLGWSTSAFAAKAPPVLLVKIDDACATAASQAQFVKALKVRLPEKTTYLTSADEQKNYWTLYWNQSPGQSCRVTLSNAQSVMALPLIANAEPNQIRDVLVRLVWVISTTPKPAPPQPKEENPKPPEEVPKKPEKKPEEAPKKEDKDKAPIKDPDPPGDVIKRPEPSKRTTKKTSTGNAIIDDMAAVLGAFRNSTPALFGDVQKDTNAMATSLFGVQTTVGFHTTLATKATIIQDESAWMGGLHVGMFLGRHFSLGVSYHTLLDDVRYDNDDYKVIGDEQDGANTVYGTRELSINAVAFDVEWVFFPQYQVQLALAVSGGLGVASWEVDYGRETDKDGNRLKDRGDNHLFAMIDVNATLYYDVTNWMQLGFGFGWRDLNGFNFNQIGPGTMSGPTGNMMLRIGFF